MVRNKYKTENTFPLTPSVFPGSTLFLTALPTAPWAAQVDG